MQNAKIAAEIASGMEKPRIINFYHISWKNHIEMQMARQYCFLNQFSMRNLILDL